MQVNIINNLMTVTHLSQLIKAMRDGSQVNIPVDETTVLVIRKKDVDPVAGKDKVYHNVELILVDRTPRNLG